MTNGISLDSAAYSRASADELILAVSSQPRVRLFLDQPPTPDSVKDAAFLATLARSRAELTVTFPFGQATRETAEALDRSLMAPFLWGTGPRTNLTRIVNGEAAKPEIVDAARKIFCASTSRLSPREPRTFQATLATGLRAAEILLPRAVFGTIASIGFELNSNAEEYGALDENGNEDGIDFRLFYVGVHDRLNPESLLARDYLAAYGKAHETGRQWLELIVTDVGVGVPYPSYYVIASETQRANRNVYQADIWEERQRLKLILDDYESTKGRFGRRLNSHTAAGEGTQIVRFQIASARGFAGVRTGRSVATWSHPSATLMPHELRALGGFEVDETGHVLFRGTIWQVLIPLDTQYRLYL